MWGSTEAGDFVGWTKQRVNYWKKKYLDPNYHSGTHGGFRYEKLYCLIVLILSYSTADVKVMSYVLKKYLEYMQPHEEVTLSCYFLLIH